MPIKCMRSPHTSYRWRESKCNQVDAPPHTSYRWRESSCQSSGCAHHQHQLQVERRERHSANQVYVLTHTAATGWRGDDETIEPIKWYVLTHTAAYRWRGERDIEPISVWLLTTHKLQGARGESHSANQ